jgi:hypothetical protein
MRIRFPGKIPGIVDRPRFARAGCLIAEHPIEIVALTTHCRPGHDVTVLKSMA